jgi:hypothetical protein
LLVGAIPCGCPCFRQLLQPILRAKSFSRKSFAILLRESVKSCWLGGSLRSLLRLGDITPWLFGVLRGKSFFQKISNLEGQLGMNFKYLI